MRNLRGLSPVEGTRSITLIALLLILVGVVAAESPPPLSAEFPGSGWIVGRFSGSGPFKFDFWGSRPDGIGFVGGTEVDAGGVGVRPFGFSQKIGIWNVAHVGVDLGSGLAVEETVEDSDPSNTRTHGGLEYFSFTGTTYYVGLIGGKFEKWGYDLTLDPGVSAELWIGEEPPMFIRVDQMDGLARVEGQATFVGAHAAVRAHYEFDVDGTLVGVFMKAPALQFVDGVDIMTATHPNGTVEDCRCDWSDLSGPGRAGPGHYRVDLTGASVRALTGETVFLLAADVDVPAWS